MRSSLGERKREGGREREGEGEGGRETERERERKGRRAIYKPWRCRQFLRHL